MSPFFRKIVARPVETLLALRGLWFILGLILTVAAMPLSEKLTYNRSMEGFFPPDDPLIHIYNENKNWFGGEGTLIISYRDEDLWSPAAMDRQFGLVQELKKLTDTGVSSVVCLADRPLPAAPTVSIGAAIKNSLYPIEEIRRQVRNTELYHQVFVAEDGLTTAFWVQLQPHFESTAQLSECLEAVRTVAHGVLSAPVAMGVITPPAVAGTPLMIHDVYEYTESDGDRLEIFSVLLMGLVIAFSLRSIRWIVLPLVIVYATLYWSTGIWAVLRGEMTMVGSAISSLVAVIGVSTVVHFGVRFQELRTRHEAISSLRMTMMDLAWPVFWIQATTAAGFAALLVCELKPVTDFAWLMVVAALLIGAAIMLFVPFGVIGLGGKGRPVRTGGMMRAALGYSLTGIQSHPFLTTIFLIGPFSFLAIGVAFLKPQTDFTRNFRESTEIFRAYDFIETQLGGAGQLDLNFSVPDLESIPPTELTVLFTKLRELSEEISSYEGATKVLGLVHFIDFFDANPLGRTLTTTARIKMLDGRIDEALEELGFAARLVPKALVDEFRKQPRVVPLFWNREEGRMRITIQARERLSSTDKELLITNSSAAANRILGGDNDPNATGIYVMLAHLIRSLLDDQKKTFALSLCFQFLMGCCAFRSIRLGLAAMIPTALPVVAVVGTMGWLSYPVNIATAMLASVSIGMTINSSILYICRFQLERRNGSSFNDALARTHATAGRAVVISNLALVLGFGVLVLSRFIPLVHFGMFTSLALLGGMAGNLVLLPLLLRLVEGGPQSSVPCSTWDRTTREALPRP